MNNEQKHPEYEPWNTDTYRTGSTRPPKNHGGIIAILLVLVILLCGIVTLLGIANIRLSLELNGETTDSTLPINFSNIKETGAAFTPNSSIGTADQNKTETDKKRIKS